MDEATFDAFYTTSFARLVGQIYAMCGDLAEAQDCVQEAFIRAWDKRRQLEADRGPEAWIRTVAYRLVVSRWRRVQRGREKLADRSISTPEPEIPDVTNVALARALSDLPADQRRAVVLFYLCGLNVNEVAQEVRAPVGTIKARLSRARSALAVLLADDGLSQTSPQVVKGVAK